ncbi:rhombotarget lipoprotein [Pseudolysobacter antarcticus]|uniref:Rhombotarget lipoprotein n=1 Tax=Pseudolysobacter antarcticus TaxID=2511995 RepID=A0A411HMQ9_9GAMM|nr:rhombotarget lipoprotein [Pseudolysobacter antarcticus]QBB71762.1 rhombotarget lipoprotein [Pseudolysobacter antarcticus]
MPRGSLPFLIVLPLLVLLLAASGCASWVTPHSVRQAGSVVDYLYPDAKEPPQLEPTVTRLHPPVRVGIAFVPGACGCEGLAEAEKQNLLQRVKDSFAQYPYIGNIEIIPSSYLRTHGGFTNLQQVASMFNIEAIALVSYDQVQFNDTNALAVLYWTVVGAYVIRGDKYDVQTMVDAAVFDVSSRKLLFRAPGTSQIKGNASMASFSQRSRAARDLGYQQAVDQLIPQLHVDLDKFKERIKSDAGFKVENKPGYSGAGDFGAFGLLLVLGLCGVGYARRAQS